jgi:DNA-directed RNA polymerase specialized sigma24 family protein
MASDKREDGAGYDARRNGRRTPEEERRRVRALTDTGVIQAMREGDSWAWGEFGVRFEPLLLAYARRLGIPSDIRRERVLDLLADEGMRLAERRVVVPSQLRAYLAKALRHRYLNERRSSARRAAAYRAAASESQSGGGAGESEPTHRSPNGVLRAVSIPEPRIEHACSESALRDALGPDASGPEASRAIEELVGYMRLRLTDEEQQILGWDERRVAHRQIAEWLGVSYDATTKRVWRLKRRLQALVADYCAHAPTPERAELERLFRRAGHNGVTAAVDRSAQTADAERGSR